MKGTTWKRWGLLAAAAAGLGGCAAPTPPLTLPAAPVTEKKAETAPAKAESPAPQANVPALVPAAPKVVPAGPAVAPDHKAEPKANGEAARPEEKSEAQRAQAALTDHAWVVALDAFSDKKNVKQLRTRLSAAGVKSYTEPVKTARGELTRVRAGPFATKEAAEKARAKLVAMGLKPGAVASR